MRHLKTKKHLEKKSKYEVFRCHVCGYVTNRKNNYIRHTNTFHHNENELINQDVYIDNIKESSNFKKSLDRI